MLNNGSIARGPAAERETQPSPERDTAFLAASEQLSSTGSFCWRVATDDVTCSHELYRILELDPQTPVTLALLLTRIQPEDLSLFRQLIEAARDRGGDIACEPRALMRDGSVKYLRLVARPKGDSSRGLEYIGAVQDVTVLRRADEAMADRAELARLAGLATFAPLAAAIAHEIKQPLAAIIMNSQTCLRMLAANPPNLDGASHATLRTIRDAQRAAEIIARLRLSVSR